MGGCRCTFRNCSVRTDGKTHLFHYPAYDKVRCHQWILNAKRYEFFNLTVSQVKNKVVCQHHFKDDCFMNYKKDKLKFIAVPTEDGPYCDPNKEEITTGPVNTYSFIADIENESYIDKKANSSMRYVDFLTNFETKLNQNQSTTEPDYFLVPPKVKPKKQSGITQSRMKGFHHVIKAGSKPKLKSEQQQFTQYEDKQKSNNVIFTQNSSNFINEENKDVPITNSMESNPNLELMQPEDIIGNMNFIVQPIPFYDNPTSINSVNPSSCDILIENQDDGNGYYNLNLQSKSLPSNKKAPPEDSKIIILSETTISEPLPYIGKFERVSPSLILGVPHKKKGLPVTTDEFNIKNTRPVQNNQTVPIEIEETIKPIIIPDVKTSATASINSDIKIPNELPKVEIDIDLNSNYSQSEKVLCTKSLGDRKEQIPKVTILKSKIAPERMAAIEKKRNFNKKLRDIVESCLEKSENQNPTNVLKVKDTDNVVQNVAATERLVRAQEYKSMAILEARIAKMENILVKKIEQNSDRITELSSSFHQTKSTASTQTSSDKELHKKYLFSEISKFLTSETSSLIYEELFINKFVQKKPDIEYETKKRKRR